MSATPIVLDANILIRAILGSKVKELLIRFNGKADFYIPEVCFEDVDKYLPVIFEKRQVYEIIQPSFYLQGKSSSFGGFF